MRSLSKYADSVGIRAWHLDMEDEAVAELDGIETLELVTRLLANAAGATA